MILRNVMAAAVVSTAVSSTASATILIFTDQFLFDSNTTTYARASENFDTYSGSYASPLTGNAGGVIWSAASSCRWRSASWAEPRACTRPRRSR